MTTQNYDVVCIFEDNQTVRFSASPVETLYQAALRGGLKLETDCREGACGVCKAYCAEGSSDLGEFSDEALTEDEEASGYLLSCQARARSDLELHYAYPLSLLRKTEKTVAATVQAVEPIAANVVRVTLTPESALDFLPGQYVNIGIPGGDSERSFSFVNAPAQQDSYHFYIRILDDGLMSNYLRDQVNVGDNVTLRGPFGQFFLRKPRGSEILMIAGGTGVGPMLSMIEEMADNYAEKPQVTLLYGANHNTELVDLEQLEPYSDWVTVQHIAVASDPEWQGPNGFVTDLIKADHFQDIAALDVYLCGPPPMIDASNNALTELGVKPERIFSEKFIPSS